MDKQFGGATIGDVVEAKASDKQFGESGRATGGIEAAATATYPAQESRPRYIGEAATFDAGMAQGTARGLVDTLDDVGKLLERAWPEGRSLAPQLFQRVEAAKQQAASLHGQFAAIGVTSTGWGGGTTPNAPGINSS